MDLARLRRRQRFAFLMLTLLFAAGFFRWRALAPSLPVIARTESGIEAEQTAAAQETGWWKRLLGRLADRSGRSALRMGLPILVFIDPQAAPADPLGLRTMASAIAYAATGIRLDDRRTLIRVGLPSAPGIPASEPAPDAPVSDSPFGGDSPVGVAPPDPEEVELPGPVTAPPRPVVSGAEPLVGIYQTHSYEAYLPELGRGKLEEAWSDDPEQGVVAVGRALGQALAEEGVSAAFSSARHHQTGYGSLGTYARSAYTARYLLEQYPTIRLLVDVHRDSAPRTQTVLKRGGETYARVLFVVGTGNPDLAQPNWRQTLQLARELDAIARAQVPGLSRGITTKPSRYNQNLLPGSVLLEVGGPENSLEEARRTVKLVARILATALREGKLPARPTGPEPAPASGQGR